MLNATAGDEAVVCTEDVEKPPRRFKVLIKECLEHTDSDGKKAWYLIAKSSESTKRAILSARFDEGMASDLPVGSGLISEVVAMGGPIVTGTE